MRIEVEDGIMVIKYGLLKKVAIDSKEGVFVGPFGTIYFDDVLGMWKNYRKNGNSYLYYIQVLTDKKIVRITPEFHKEKYADRVMNFIKKQPGLMDKVKQR